MSQLNVLCRTKIHMHGSVPHFHEMHPSFILVGNLGVYILVCVCVCVCVCEERSYFSYAVVTPLRKAASYEPRIAILWIWGDTSLTRGKYGIYVAVRGSYEALTGSTWCLLEILPRKISTFYCRVSTWGRVTRIPSLVLHNTWHYVIIRRQKYWFPKFVLRCSYEAALRKGVTTALVKPKQEKDGNYVLFCKSYLSYMKRSSSLSLPEQTQRESV